MSDLREVDHQTLRNALGGMCFASAGLAEGTNANTIKTTVATTFNIAGQLYAKAITDNIAMTALAVQAVLTKCMYLVLIDSAGAVSLVKGTEVASSASAYLPANPTPTTKAVIGAMKVVLAGAATFTSGTTDLSASNVTATFYNLSHAVPDAF